MQTEETYKKWKKDPLRYQDEIQKDLEHRIYIPEGASAEVMNRYLRLITLQSEAATALINANNKILQSLLEARRAKHYLIKPGEA